RVRFPATRKWLAPLKTCGRDGDPDRGTTGLRGEECDRVLGCERGQTLVPRPRDRANELVAPREQPRPGFRLGLEKRQRPVDPDDHVAAARARVERAHPRTDGVEQAIGAPASHDVERRGAVRPRHDRVVADAEPGDLAHVPWRSGDWPVAARDVVQPLEDDSPRGLWAPPGPFAEPAFPDEREDAVRLESRRRALEPEAPAARGDLDRVGVHLAGR